MQIKTIMRYCLTPVNMATIHKSTNKYLQRCGERDPSALLVEMQTGTATVESSMEVPQKIKYTTTLWHNNSTSGHVSEETQNTNSKEYMHSSVNCSIIYNS